MVRRVTFSKVLGHTVTQWGGVPALPQLVRVSNREVRDGIVVLHENKAILPCSTDSG